MGLLKKEFTIETNKFKSEIIESVRDKTDERTNSFVIRFEKGKEFSGSVTDVGFDIKSIRGLDRRLNPRIIGEVLDKSVKIVLEPSMPMMIATALIFMFILFSLFMLINNILKNSISSGINIFLILNSINLINYLFIRYKINYSKTQIIETINQME